MNVSVFIPTLNAGPELDNVLQAIKDQVTEREVEIRVVDSGSTDETLDILRQHDIGFRSISTEQFNHGGTRNEAARECRGDLVAFLSQDARPADGNWLEELAAPFQDTNVVGTYARQMPREDCHPFQRLNLDRHMERSATALVREPLDASEYASLSPRERLARISFDNVSSMVRRETLAAIPFPETAFGEDLSWGRQCLLAGHRIAFSPGARVLHSHPVNAREFGLRVSQAHQAMKREAGFVAVPSRGMQLRRTLGTAWRFLEAALTSGEFDLFQRLGFCLAAAPCAIRQVAAMHHGGHAVEYTPPA